MDHLLQLVPLMDLIQFFQLLHLLEEAVVEIIQMVMVKMVVLVVVDQDTIKQLLEEVETLRLYLHLKVIMVEMHLIQVSVKLVEAVVAQQQLVLITLVQKQFLLLVELEHLLV